MSSHCVVCGDETTVSDACSHCGALVCPIHRRPSAHGCVGTDAGETHGWRLDLNGTDAPESDDSLTALFRPGVGLAVLTLVLVALAVGVVAYAEPLAEGPDTRAIEERIADESNAERSAAGVAETTVDADLAAVARAHSEDMRDRGFVDHTNPDGATPLDRVETAGIDCVPGENIYQTPRGAIATSDRAFAAAVVRSWMDSPGHRETLLRESYTRQGVGVAVDDSALYATQLFCPDPPTE